MPANVGTLSVTPSQAVSQGGLLGKISGNSVTMNGTNDNLACPPSADEEQARQKDSVRRETVAEGCYYESLPVRQLHEKFMRRFVDLLLEEAVFEVRSEFLERGVWFGGWCTKRIYVLG